MPSNLSRQAYSGVAWSLLQNVGSRLIAFLSQIALAWVLNPGDFGDISLVYSLSGIVNTLVTFGVDDVLRSRPKTIHRWVPDANGFCLILGLLGGLLLAVTAKGASLLYQNVHIFPMASIIAASIPIATLATVPGVYLSSALRFRFLSTYATLEFAGTQVLIVLLAWRGLGPYSFVLPLPFAAAIKVVVFWKTTPLSFRLRVRQLFFIRLLRTGALVFGQKLATAIRSNGDYLMLGLLATRDATGYYFFAFRLASMPVYTLTNSLIAVLFPALAKLQHDPDRQLAATLKASRILAIIIIPLSFLSAVMAPHLLHLLFGDKWLNAVSVFQILSIGLAFDVAPCVAGALLDANGKFRKQFIWALITLPFFLVLIFFGGLWKGPEGVALCVTIYFAIAAPVYSYSALHIAGGIVRDVIEIYLPPIVGATLASGSAIFLNLLWPQAFNNDFVGVALIAIWAVAVYLFLITILAPRAAHEAKEAIVSVIETRRRRSAT